jgi:hypothetical protein
MPVNDELSTKESVEDRVAEVRKKTEEIKTEEIKAEDADKIAGGVPPGPCKP